MHSRWSWSTAARRTQRWTRLDVPPRPSGWCCMSSRALGDAPPSVSTAGSSPRAVASWCASTPAAGSSPATSRPPRASSIANRPSVWSGEPGRCGPLSATHRPLHRSGAVESLHDRVVAVPAIELVRTVRHRVDGGVPHRGPQCPRGMGPRLWDQRGLGSQPTVPPPRHGGGVWFEAGLDSGYVPRATLHKLARQYFGYGRAKGRWWVRGQRPALRQLALFAAPPACVLLVWRLSHRVGAAGWLLAPAGLLLADAVGAREPPIGAAERTGSAAVIATYRAAWWAGVLSGAIEELLGLRDRPA